MTKYEFNVEMTCEGCSNAMNRLLTKQKEKGEIEEFSVDLATKTVSVTSTKELPDVVTILEKSGKKVAHTNTHD